MESHCGWFRLISNMRKNVFNQGWIEGAVVPWVILKIGLCKTKYKMSPSSVRSKGGEAAAGYCLNSVSYRVDEAVKYNVLNSD